MSTHTRSPDAAGVPHTDSYYASSVNAHAPWPELTDNIECDVCIVGAGYTGIYSA